MRLFAKVQGSGDPVVILHGLFGSLNNWNTLGKRLAEAFKVYLVDQRNHGRSPHNATHTYKAMADDLFEFFGEQRISAAYLVGHSMGGKTAMEFALSHPEAVRKLVVVDIAPQHTPARHDEIIEALSSLDLSRYAGREEIDEALQVKIQDQTVRQFLLTNLRREEGGHYSWKMNLDALQRNYGEINRGIDNGREFGGPVLFVRGERSPYLRDEHIPFIKSLFPNASFATVPGVGHWVHAEAPDQFFEIVRGFISSS